MTKKERVALETTEKEETEVESESQDDESTEDTGDESGDESTSKEENTVDYKAVALAERERAERAEKALAGDRYRSSEKKRKGEAIDEDDSGDEAEEDDKPLTAKDLKAFAARIEQRTEKKLLKSQALKVARENTDSEDEAQAALIYYENRIVPTGEIEDDVLSAIAILNRRKTSARNSELKRALRGKDMASRETAGTHRDSAKGPGPKLSSGDAEAYKRAGFSLNKTTKLYEKKLDSGKVLIKDPKTKQTYLQK